MSSDVVNFLPVLALVLTREEIMTTNSNKPSELNDYLQPHVRLLLDSFHNWTGKNLIHQELSGNEQARELFYAPFVVLSHDSARDPLLNYGNEAGLHLFELNWEELISLPSRFTAEGLHRDERARLLRRVTEHGYIGDYTGVRISRAGRRFLIDQAIVWQVRDEQGGPYGQAATFSRWRFLD
jgi:MEKHLA domain-containing protein